jgi:hypothetical protein
LTCPAQIGSQRDFANLLEEPAFKDAPHPQAASHELVGKSIDPFDVGGIALVLSSDFICVHLCASVARIDIVALAAGAGV